MQNKSTLLKVVSILLIIGGALGAIMSLVGVMGSLAITLGLTSLGIVVVLIFVLALAISAFEIVCGAMGLVACKNPSKLKACFILAIILIVLSGISIITTITNGSFQWSSVGGIVLPILYLLGIKQIEG